MKVLVTGGAGYIGSHTALALLEQGMQVVVLDDLSTGAREQVPAGAAFVQGNMGDSALVARVLQQHDIDAIMHFAAFIKVGESVAEPLRYYDNNVGATARLLEAAAGKVKYVIFSSSAAVYGNPATAPVPEDAALSPLSPYAHTKAMGERMLQDAAAAHGLRYVALRYFNVAGADPKGRAGYAIEGQPSHLIRTALAAALGRREGLEVFGTDYPTKDGTCVRDYIHVSDLADAHVEALRYLADGGDSLVLNCGYGIGHSVLQVIDAVKRVTGNDFKVTLSPRRPGDPALNIADVSRMRAALPDWKPRFTDLDAMIRHQLQWERSKS